MDTQQEFNLPDFGACFLPREFANFTGPLGPIEVVDTATRPSSVLAHLIACRSVVLIGDYGRADGIYRFCARNERQLVAKDGPAAEGDRRQRISRLTAACRMRLHHLLVPARGDSLVGLTQPPDTTGLQQWLGTPTGDSLFLIPVRRLQRILTDMRRARDGLAVAGLSSPITILPHVYVPADMSVPVMLNDFAPLISGKRVLDMGTGTGVLALLAAHLGASEVTATDSNPKAVENARVNAERLGMSDRVKVRGPSNLFDAMGAEQFDVIIFNAPWSEGVPKSLYDTAIYDPGHSVLAGFMKAAPAHLAAGGAILLQYSDVSDGRGGRSLDSLTSILEENGLHMTSTRSVHRQSRLTGTGETVRFFEIRKLIGER
ncbi:MAG: 50S ribosomal protein L11 methyltransferase [bacterium]